ncbi:MAG TPA: endolytic transglycosylase MltG, partial [Solirubrobacteraceae bacterium]|nr:endolytic transglycosylase MltG [Solirubrobacteraceae bacterium]
AARVGDLLERRGVIASSFFFSLRARLEGKRDELQAGTFTLRRDMPYAAAIDVLTHNPPPPPTVKLTIPEGRTRHDIAALAERAGIRGDYLELSARRTAQLDPHGYGAPRARRNLEGFLFPATYELRRSQATAANLIAQQLQAFQDNFADVDLTYARERNLTAYDVLIIASMIEREAAVPKDRRLISAVIYNRLHDHMPLGIDATLRYALDDWSRPLTTSQLRTDSPFNTRLHTGLPPTPIGNPGLASIEAAAKPARVPYLYYVVKPCGHGAHAFSATAQQFEHDVAAYEAARAKAGGKSPIDC